MLLIQIPKAIQSPTNEKEIQHPLTAIRILLNMLTLWSITQQTQKFTLIIPLKTLVIRAEKPKTVIRTPLKLRPTSKLLAIIFKLSLLYSLFSFHISLAIFHHLLIINKNIYNLLIYVLLINYFKFFRYL